MKIILAKSEYWIKDDTVLPSNFNQMDSNEKLDYTYKNNLFHRENGPAVIYSDGSQFWYLNGLLHRENGPTAIYSDGSKVWYFKGKMHRADGPTIVYHSGDKWWYLNGLCHRIDGPAMIKYNGYKTWYLNDIRVDEEIYKKIERSSKEELLMYAVLPKYKDYISLIDYRLNIV